MLGAQALRRAAEEEGRQFARRGADFASGLAPLLQGPADPQALASRLEERRAALRELVKGKGRLLGEAALLLRSADGDYVRLLTQSAGQVDALLEARLLTTAVRLVATAQLCTHSCLLAKQPCGAPSKCGNPNHALSKGFAPVLGCRVLASPRLPSASQWPHCACPEPPPCAP